MSGNSHRCEPVTACPGRAGNLGLIGVDYVPALCTHRPSLLPIGCAGEMFGLAADGGSPHFATEKFIKPSHLEEGEVVTRFP